MGKRKVKSKLLTKIDPALLKQKPQAISQHAASDGTRVTTTIKPACQPLVLPAIFGADTLNFNKEHSEDGDDDDEVSQEYYITRVCALSVSTSGGSFSPG
jgi:hypothetical protein